MSLVDQEATDPTAPSFFLAGVMQGGRRGAELADQSYRGSLERVIRTHLPNAVVHDPGEIMWRNMEYSRARIREDHARLEAATTVVQKKLSAPLAELVEKFHGLTDLASKCDVCVAWLPGNEPSMGTMAEVLCAYRAGRTVVAVTQMRQNLAMLACTTVMVPDLEHFHYWLAGWTRREGAA